MWKTKSTNCITVDGAGQKGHSAAARGRIVAFSTSDKIDYVAGQAAEAYNGALENFTRHILFIKPNLIIVFDQLQAPRATGFEWHLHSLKKMQIAGQKDIRVTNNNASVRVSFLAPEGLKLSLTDKFDPPPRPRIKLTEWHLTAKTPGKSERMEFVTVIRPYRTGTKSTPAAARLHKLHNGYAVESAINNQKIIVLLGKTEKGSMSFKNRSTKAQIAAFILDSNGKLLARFPE